MGLANKIKIQGIDFRYFHFSKPSQTSPLTESLYSAPGGGPIRGPWAELQFNGVNTKTHNNFNFYNYKNNIEENKLKLFTNHLIHPFNNGTNEPSGKSNISISEFIKGFSVLIYKNDINKITDIGPFIKEDGTETNIHLVII